MRPSWTSRESRLVRLLVSTLSQILPILAKFSLYAQTVKSFPLIKCIDQASKLWLSGETNSMFHNFQAQFHQ